MIHFMRKLVDVLLATGVGLMLAALLLYGLGALFASQAQAATLGAHLVSYHGSDNERYENFNYGLYLRTDSGQSIGVYRNSLDRTSVYVAQSLEYRSFSVTLGVVSGYQKQTEVTPPRGQNGHCEDGNPPPCTEVVGHTSGALGPLLVLSYAAPEVLGVVPRLSVVPGLGGASTVFHLSMEYQIK